MGVGRVYAKLAGSRRDHGGGGPPRRGDPATAAKALTRPRSGSAASLNAFLAKFSPRTRSVAGAALKLLRARLPGAVELVYDNYNALVIGFGPNERPSDAVLSVAVYRGHVNLGFLQGAVLEDPHGLLQGSGNQFRHIKLIPDASVLDRPDVRALVEQAIAASDVPFVRRRSRRIVIRLVSKKQRPRR